MRNPAERVLHLLGVSRRRDAYLPLFAYDAVGYDHGNLRCADAL